MPTAITQALPNPVAATDPMLPTSSGPLPDTLHIVRSLMFPTRRNDLDQTIRDRAQVQQLYRTIQALPSFPQYAGCPIDWGVQYHLTFFRDQAVIGEMLANAGGCNPLFMAAENKPDVELRRTRGPTDLQFWSLLAQMLRLGEKQLNPTPLSGS